MDINYTKLESIHCALQELQQEFNIPNDHEHLETAFKFTEDIREEYLEENIKESEVVNETTYVECVECGDKFNKFQGDMDERTCMTCILKREDPDVIRPIKLTGKRKLKN